MQSNIINKLDERAQMAHDARIALGLGPNDPLPIYVKTKVIEQLTGRTADWLERERWKGTGPAYIKKGSGRACSVFYHLIDTLLYFKNH